MSWICVGLERTYEALRSVRMLRRLICWSKNSDASIIIFWVREARGEGKGQLVMITDGLPFSAGRNRALYASLTAITTPPQSVW